MGELLSELLGELFIKPVLMGLCYLVGCPIVFLFSFGMLHTSLDEPSKNEKKGMRWHGATFVRHGKRYLIRELVALIGLVFWGLLIALLVLAKR